MKIAVISDIHGNIEAFDAVLDDINLEKCDKIFCLGDLAMAGPEPSLAIKKVQELLKHGNFELIQGNTDEMLSDFSEELLVNLKALNETMANAYQADINELSIEDKNFLSSLNKEMAAKIEGVKILFVHGSPRKNNENIYPNMPIGEIEEIISSTDADIIFCGHTHMPCGYQTNSNQTVVNVGSVGRPFTQEPKSCYAIAEISSIDDFTIKHKFVEYDTKIAADKLSGRKFSGADKLAQMLKKPGNRYP